MLSNAPKGALRTAVLAGSSYFYFANCDDSTHCFSVLLPMCFNVRADQYKRGSAAIRKTDKKWSVNDILGLFKSKGRMWEKQRLHSNWKQGINCSFNMSHVYPKNGAFYINTFKQKCPFETHSLFKRYRRSLCPPQELNIVNAMWTITWRKKKALNLLKELIYCTPVSTNPHVQKFSKCWGIKRSKLLPGSKPFNIQQQNRQTILSVSE